ncbi:Transmembrane protein [Melia azedarach]|uniref:Transmembrane protein n=1 Tax=Melia azedarach TaxID=155640 RepID=A0ACC1XQW7_MELAZ|nr:Transmembrane protein [Melia azedarach]
MKGDSSAGAGAAGGEMFQDWELLHNSESDLVNSENSVENPRSFEEMEGDCSEGIIRLDYFSLDGEKRYAKTGVVDVSEEGSVESDNPSWIDPGSETRYQRKTLGEFWSDSGTGEIQDKDKDLDRFWSDSGGDGLLSMSFDGFEKENETRFGDHVKKEDESEICGESDGGNGSLEENSSVVIEGERKSIVKSSGEDEKGRVAWWKVPFEVFKYCILKVNPAWSFSVAAAVMGLVILGRRLYRMKQKSKSLQLKVTLDDKKVSQFMSRAARLNEAFSVVRRVPIVRPSLSVAGVNPWPVVSLR